MQIWLFIKTRVHQFRVLQTPENIALVQLSNEKSINLNSIRELSSFSQKDFDKLYDTKEANVTTNGKEPAVLPPVINLHTAIWIQIFHGHMILTGHVEL